MNIKKSLLVIALVGISGSAAALEPFYAICNSCDIATPVPDGSATDPGTTLGMLEHLKLGGHWSFPATQTAWVCNATAANDRHDGTGCATYQPLPGGGWTGGPLPQLPDTLCQQVFKRDQASAPCTFPDPGDTWHGTPPIGFTFDVLDFGTPVLWCMGRLGCTPYP